MPALIAIAGAAFSVSAGMTAIAAGSSIIGGLMVAGGALAGIGTLTGNKKLAKIGGILSLAGGLGNLAQGLVKETAGKAAADAAAQEAAKATAGNTIADVTGTATEGLSEAAGAASVADDVAMMGNVGNGAPLAGAGGDILQASYGMPSQGLLQGGFAEAGGLGGPMPAGGPGFEVGSIGAPAQPPGMIQRLFGDTAVGKTAASWADSAGNAMKGVDAWTKANPTMAKVASGMIQGAAGYYGQTQAMKDNMERQKQYADWVRQRYSDSVRNLTIPAPTAQLSPGIIGGSR